SGTPLLDSPTRTIFFGNRLLNLAFQAAASYHKSSRFSLNFHGGAVHTQTLTSGSPSDVAPLGFTNSNYNSAIAGMSLSYSFTPRTQIGASVETQRMFSTTQDVVASTWSGSLSRSLSPRWRVSVQGGAGFQNSLISTYKPTGAQYVYSST